MSDFNGYAVFLFPNALEALGDAIRPYLQDSPGGPHILCRDIDVGGPLTELTLEGRTTDGRNLDLELMFPTNMVRMIISARTDANFGFGPRVALAPAASEPPVVDDDTPGPAHVTAPKGGVRKQAAKTAPARKAPAKRTAKKPAKKKR